MIAVKARFLAGRYHATPWGRHVNEGVPEWPPSPWRFFRALIASWQTVCKDMQAEQVAVLLSKLAATIPSFWLPPATAGHIRCYMPWFKKNYDDRTLVFDTFISLSKDDKVRFIWPGAELTEIEKDALARLLKGISYMGRAESWCELTLEHEPPYPNCFPLEGQFTADPLEYEEVRVLVPKASDLIPNLLVETSELRTKQKRLDPPGSHWVTYARRRNALAVKPIRRTRAGLQHDVVAVRFALDRYHLPPVQETVILGEQSRIAVLGRYGRMFNGEASAILVGKDGPNPMKGHNHAFYLPTDEDNDGRIDHLTIYVPAGLGERERMALGNLREIPWGDRQDIKDIDEGRRLRVILLGFYTLTELAGTLPFAGPAKTWVSITPYVLTRFPKVYRDGRPKLSERNEQIDGAEDQARREWRKLQESNPSLPDIANISVLHQTMEKPVRWLSYKTRRNKGKGSSSGFVYGLQLEFNKPLLGPLALGYGCHYGLGQFMPLDE